MASTTTTTKSIKSLHYNHYQWPSPRAVRFVRELAKYGYVKRPAGRLTHDKALGILADKLAMTVPMFLRDITTIGLLKRIGARPACYGGLVGRHAGWYYNDYYYNNGIPIPAVAVATAPAPVPVVRTIDVLLTSLVEMHPSLSTCQPQLLAVLNAFKGQTL